MIKHTLQEWADLTGCWVAVASDGRVFLFQSRPYLSNNQEWIGYEVGMISYQLVDYSGDWRDSLTASSESPFKEGEWFDEYEEVKR